MRYLWPTIGLLWVVCVVLYTILRSPKKEELRQAKSLEEHGLHVRISHE